MTDEMMSLRGLIEKSADADLLREMIGFAAQRPMELEVGELTGAAYGGKNPERLAQRNGYRTETGRPVPARSSFASPSSGRAPASRASSSPGAWRRRLSPR